MTLYVVDVTVPADTPADNPVEVELVVEEDVVTRVACHFPPGCRGFVHTAVFIGHIQVFPRPFPNTLHGDAETISWEEWLPLPETPCKLTIRAWSPGARYPHTITWRIIALPRYVAMWWWIFERFISLLKLIFRVREEWLSE
jgi:hypothetical protein